MAVVIGVVAIDIPGVPDVGGAVRDTVVGSLSDVVGGMITGIVTDFISPAISSVTGELVKVMQSSSQVDLTGDFGGLAPVRATILGLSLAMMLGLLFVNVIRATLRGEPGALVRAAFYEVPRTGLITAVYLMVAQVAIVIVDGVSSQVLVGVPEAIGRIGGVIVVTGAATGGINLLMVIFMIAFILAAMFVWAELLIRSAMIYIVAVLAPLGYALGASPNGREVSRRTSLFLFSIIVSKLGIAVAFRVGASLVDSVGQGGEWSASDAMVGLTAMLLAAFMPFMVLKAIPIMEAATVTGGAERAPLRAAATVAGTALAVTTVGRLAGTGGGVGSGGATPPPLAGPSGSGHWNPTSGGLGSGDRPVAALGSGRAPSPRLGPGSVGALPGPPRMDPVGELPVGPIEGRPSPAARAAGGALVMAPRVIRSGPPPVPGPIPVSGAAPRQLVVDVIDVAGRPAPSPSNLGPGGLAGLGSGRPLTAGGRRSG